MGTSKKKKIVKGKVKTIRIRPVLNINNPDLIKAPLTYGFITIPHKSIDASCLLTIDSKVKEYAPMSKLDLSTSLNEVHILDKNLKAIMAYTACRSNLPQGIRRVVNTSSYSGGVRIALCKGKGNSCQAVISNTGKQLTFQRQSTVLPLEKLHTHAVSLGMPQINPKGNPAGSFCAYSVYDIDKAKSLVDKAIELIK